MSGRARFAAVAIAVGAFASLGGVGYAAGLMHFAHSSPTAAQYPQSKVTICHHTHSQKNPFVTITVSVHALPAHLGHGDTIGPCPALGASGAQGPTEKLTKVHSNQGHQVGKGHTNGNGKSATSPTANHGQDHQSQGQGKGQGHNPTGPSQSHGKGHGNGKGHDPAHGHGQGQGQGHGQGQGPGGTHGNSGGKGNGHKP